MKITKDHKFYTWHSLNEFSEWSSFTAILYCDVISQCQLPILAIDDGLCYVAEEITMVVYYHNTIHYNNHACM